jgi:hypothetical protein
MAGKKKQGLYANIHAKQERVKHGSGEKMRSPGEKGAPSAKAFEQSEKSSKSHGTKSSGSSGKSKSKK